MLEQPMLKSTRSYLKLLFTSTIIFLVFVCLVAGLIYKFALSAPSNFPVEQTIIIDPGQSLTSIANEMSANGVARSSGILRSFMIIFGGERKVYAGYYVFHKPANVIQIAHRIVNGDFGYVPVKITIPEGTNVFKIADIVHEKFPQIDEAAFLDLIKSHEGYLFPNTYFLPPMTTPQMVVDMMTKEFEKEIKPLNTDIASSTHSIQDIITMASILEGEVQTEADRKMVADILWRRISLGMPLQVDSTFTYINGKPSSELTLNDLKIDSPYNLYKYKGLTPTPISNPGLQTIKAALHPTPNDYLYFLSDKNGITHYAHTNEEQSKLKKKYLK